VKTDHRQAPDERVSRWNLVASSLEHRLLRRHAEMLTWTELAAYLSVVTAMCGGGAALYWALLWRE